MASDLGSAVGANPYPGFAAAFKSNRATVEKNTPQASPLTFKAIGSSPDGVIVGIGASAGTPTKLDKDQEFVDKAGLVQMAYDFCASKDRTFKANHKEDIDVDLVASWPGAPIIKAGSGVRVLAIDEPLDASMEVVGIDITKGNETHWFVGARPRDPEIAALAAKGGIAGFSFGAAVNREPVGD